MPYTAQRDFVVQRYLLSRVLQSILVLFGVLLLVFFLVRATGDPARLMMSREASDAEIAAFRHEMGFDRPEIVQFGDFMAHAVVGDFGESLNYRESALALVLERLPATVELALVGLLMAVVLAIPLGLLAGSRPGSWADSASRFMGLLGQTVPNFWLGMLLILVFAVRFRVFPSFGRDKWSSVILPAFALGMVTMGQMVRLTRAAVLEVRNQDYIRTAFGKGLSSQSVYIGHVLRNVAVPLISFIGVEFGYMLGGSIYIETIFSWPGLGNMVAQAVANRDFPLVQAVAFFTSFVVVLLNLMTDNAYGLIDPRIRYGK